MFKKLLLISVFYFSGLSLFSQGLPDDVVNELKVAKNDSALVFAMDKAAAYFRERDRDSAIAYIQAAINICTKNKQFLMQLRFKNLLANQLLSKQQLASAYSMLSAIIVEAKEVNRKNSTWLFNPDQPLEVNVYSLLSSVYQNLQILMQQTSNWKEWENNLMLMKKYADLLPEKERNVQYSRLITARGYAFLSQNKLDSAVLILKSGENNSDFAEILKSFLNMVFGSVYAKKGDYDKAKDYLTRAILKSDSRNVTTRSLFKMSQIYRQLNQVDSAYYYGRMLLDTLRQFGSANFEVDLGVAYENMYQCFFAMNKMDSSFKYARLAIRTTDSLTALRLQNLKEFQQLSFAEQKRLEETELERKNRTVRWFAYGSLAFAVLVGLIAFILFRNARQRKKTNGILVKQKEVLEQTLEQLKSTQAQLIQSEKMASLGELTAGIAHEIQNPLNFVNNFSDVSMELIGEMRDELATGNFQSANEIASDIVMNLEKIHHHGKRADAIVKGMLQHSRSSTGQKESTDINALCEEYLRLAYHGLGAKDKEFNATMKTDFDETIGNINVIQQDIGRVILNLINNAFYAVNEKSKQGITGYEPTVSVSTKKEGNKVLISVKDNGNGIPQKMLDKIFQPFFTTKPTGQGTGLGLSLSYDIVKAHGGELKLETMKARPLARSDHSGGEEPVGRGEGACFIIQLPMA